jgi:hypothetical protein
MKAYKYRSEYNDTTLTLLSRSRIFAPTKHQLNDPFEGTVQKKIFDDYEFLKPYLSPSRYENRINNINKLLTQITYSGIYSLSKTFDNEVLWVHYSDIHKGYCIEYELDDLILEKTKTIIFPKIIEVQYSEEPPVYTLDGLDNYTQDELQDYFLKTLIGTKSSPWCYENEIRVLFNENGEQEINSKAIKSIIFGAFASEADINETIKIMLDKVEYYKIEIANYKLHKNPI